MAQDVFYRITYGARSFTQGQYSAGAVGHREGPSTSVSYSSILHGEPIPNATSMGGRTIVVSVLIAVPEDSLAVQKDLEGDLKRYIEASRASRQWRPLLIQETADVDAVWWWAVPGDIVPDSEVVNLWHITFHAKPVGYSEQRVDQVYRIDPRFNILSNPSFETWTGTKAVPTITSWSGTGTAGYSITIAATSLFGAYALKLTPPAGAGSTAGVYQSTTLTAASWVASFWFGVQAGSAAVPVLRSYDGSTSGTTTTRAVTGGESVTADGITWTRYRATWVGTVEAGQNIQVLSQGGVAFLDAVQLEPGTLPRDFHDKALWETWLLHTPGGYGIIEPELGVKPISAPAGPDRYKLGPYKVDSPANIGMHRSLCQVFIGAQSEVAAGRLRADGNDLQVVLPNGRRLKRWITNTDALGNSLADWVIWFEPLEIGSTPRYIYLVYGNPNALDPARWGPPDGLSVAWVQPTQTGDAYLGQNVEHYYGVAAATSADGRDETLLSGLVSVNWDEDHEVALRWNRQPNATWYLVYRGRKQDDGSAPTSDKMYLVGRTQNPWFRDTGARPISGKHPRTTGSNPATPYDRQKPLWELRDSRNTVYRFTKFYDRGKPARDGTWTADARNASPFYLTETGVKNVRDGSAVAAGDEWQLGFPFDVTRVRGTVRVRQHPDRSRLIVRGQKSGRVTDIYKAGDQMSRPEFEVRVRNVAAGETSTLAAGTYQVGVAAKNSAGDVTDIQRKSVKVTTGSAQKIEVYVTDAVAQATSYPVYLSRDADPKYKSDITTAQVGSWVAMLSGGGGAVAPKSNETVQIYPVLTTLAAFDVTLTDPVRQVRYWLSQDREYRSTPLQEAYISELWVHFDPAQAPTVENASVPVGGPAENPHLDVEVWNRRLGHRIRADLIEVPAGREMVINADMKSVTDDAQGNPQRDALSIRHINDAWFEMEPKEVNPIGIRLYPRADFAGTQDLDFRLRYFKRYP